MNFKKNSSLLVYAFLLICLPFTVAGQVENDSCEVAILLEEVVAYCSDTAAFSNIGALEEPPNSDCLSANGKAVWFKFMALHPGLRVRVIGEEVEEVDSLLQPEIALIETANCEIVTGNVLACVEGDITNEANLDVGELIIGQEYYIKVQGKEGAEGTFQLCIDNFPIPTNDRCDQAMFLDSIESYRSEPRTFSTLNASDETGMKDYECLENGKDVWFRFIVEATDLIITVTGNIDSEFPGGSLEQPQIELFGIGDCPNGIQSLKCSTDRQNENLTILKQQGLTIGQEYLMRVQGAGEQTGTFQLDITNYFPASDPESDCPDAKLLCEKSVIRVETLEGGGSDPDEGIGTCLKWSEFENSEFNSTWYKWIAGNDGSLTFSINPDTYEDDLDFVVYELPEGVSDCTNKIPIRCMASGASFDLPFSRWRECVGPTGLREGETDTKQNGGCGEEANAFLAPIQMKKGTTYALLINYNSFGLEPGFSIEFGGTGEFEQIDPTPTIDIVAPSTCEEDQIIFTGSNAATIYGQEETFTFSWEFGENALPTSAAGIGPHEVQYLAPGDKVIALSLASKSLSCDAREIEEDTVSILPCCGKFQVAAQLLDIENINCLGEDSGTIRVEGVGGIPPYSYSIDGGVSFQESGDLDNLPVGMYAIMVKDQKACIGELEATIVDRSNLSVNILMEESLVPLGTNIVLETEVFPTNNSIQYSWSNADLLDCNDCPNPSYTALQPTYFAVTVTDEDNCSATDSVLIQINPNRELYIPNVFSPNNDGINDRFGLFGGSAVQEILFLRIFDRWGNIVYEQESLPSGSTSLGWDGTFNGRDVPAGVYTYYAAALFIDEGEVIFEGYVTIVR